LANSQEINASAGAAPTRPWASLTIRDYRLVWIASVCNAVAIQVRNVAGLYQVYAISGSALQLGLTGFFQAFPFVIFGLFAGAVADAFDRKKLLVVTVAIQLIPSLLLGFLTMTGTIQGLAYLHLGFCRRAGRSIKLAGTIGFDPAPGAAVLHDERGDAQHDHHPNQLSPGARHWAV
jgi:MFS family permease